MSQDSIESDSMLINTSVTFSQEPDEFYEGITFEHFLKVGIVINVPPQWIQYFWMHLNVSRWGEVHAVTVNNLISILNHVTLFLSVAE